MTHVEGEKVLKICVFHLFIDWLVLTPWVLPVVPCHDESVQAQGAQMESRSVLQSSMGFLLIPLYDVNSVNYLESAGMLGLFVTFVD